ncbi:MAG: hypothetical protein DRJ02_09275 [Bacteroidetes bacterium]|nr:MAG: hypothetical protein DRJ02_09275 [Bacteroidota bacterium]
MSTFFIFLYKHIQKHAIVSILLLVALVFAAAWFASRVSFSEDITNVLPESKKINRLNFVLDNSEFMEKVVFNIRLNDSTQKANPDLLADFTRQLADSIARQHIPERIRNIEKPPDDAEMMKLYDFVYNHLPVFLDSADYEILAEKVSDPAIRQSLESDLKTLISPAGFGVKKMIKNDPLHFTVLAIDKFKMFQLSGNFELYNGQFITKDHRNILLIVTPVYTNNSAVNEVLFSDIDRLINQLKQQEQFRNIEVDYFGNAVVALGNARRIKKDIVTTVSIAAVLLIIAITAFFRKKRTVLIIFMPLVFGVLVSLAFFYFLRSNISAISLGIGSVLVGISVDYALHIFSHYRKNLDIKALYKDITTPILMSSFTTAAAFMSLFFLNSRALNDLGLFAAISILSAALFSLIVLPHLIRTKSTRPPKQNLLDKLAAYHLKKKNLIWPFILLLTIVFYFFSGNVSFDADMMKNNYMSERLKKAEQELNRITSLSKKTIYLVSPGSTMDAALTANESTKHRIDSLANDGVIKESVVINHLFKPLAEQKKAIERWNRFRDKYGTQIKENLEQEGSKIGFKKSAFQNFEQFLDKDFEPVTMDQAGLLFAMLLDKYVIETDTMAAVINVVKVDSDPQAINKVYKTFDTDSSVWVVDKRLVTSELVRLLNDNLNKLVWVSLLVVFVILLIAYGRIELTIITMIPVLVSWIWTVGIMGLFGISFNIFNVIILTFIFGLGIDYSIFIMRGLIQGYKYGLKDLSSYKVSVLLSVLTTVLGIGVLIFAKHPALRSIALMSIIGIATVVFVTFNLLPGIFRWVVSYKNGLRNRPVTFLDLIFSIISLFIFMSEALLMSFLALIFEILPGNPKKKKWIFHVIFSKLTWFLIYFNFLTPKKILNPENEDFSKPAVIIANHQSHVDLMLMMLTSPKILIVSNARNYYNPVHGKAIRYADFLPQDIGYGKLAEMAAEKVNEGYSIMIFPEGHRSDTGVIRRFHKGAFQLANDLGIDILPIIIHGQYQCLKKSEFFLKRGFLETKILQRIDLSKKEFGETVKEQTKSVREYFIKEYDIVKKDLETPDYFYDYIIKNFVYKGPVLEWYTKIKVQLEDKYKFFNSIIPCDAVITDLGCGYGYLDFMLSLTEPGRRITAVDYDEDKIEIARNCAIKNERIQFMAGDINEMDFKPSDVFILNDVLHYMPEALQTETIEKCIARLNNGGMIIIRDADKSLQKRHLGTRITEFFSTNFGFNKTRFRLEFASRTLITGIAARHKLTLDIVDQTKRTSNLIYLLKKQG